MSPARLVASDSDEGKRLDRMVSDAFPDVSRSVIQQLIESGKVHIVGRSARSSEKIHRGDVVEVRLELPQSLTARPEPLALNVIYEDESMVILDKPSGLVVHPAAGHAGGTLVNGLLYRYPSLGAGRDIRPGLVHRLDKDTSGLMVVGLTPAGQMSLTRQLQSRRMKRRYRGLVWGGLEPPRALIDIPVGRDPASRTKMAAGNATIHPRSARTHYEVLEIVDRFTYVDVRLDTGRTHQIRIHMAYIGHPIVGDSTYGPSAPVPGLTRQFLHAYVLELESPLTGLPMTFRSDLPPDLDGFLTEARAQVGVN